MHYRTCVLLKSITVQTHGSWPNFHVPKNPANTDPHVCSFVTPAAAPRPRNTDRRALALVQLNSNRCMNGAIPILLAKTRTTIGRLDAIAGGRSEVPDYEKFTVAWPTTTAVERRPPTGEVRFLHPD